MRLLARAPRTPRAPDTAQPRGSDLPSTPTAAAARRAPAATRVRAAPRGQQQQRVPSHARRAREGPREPEGAGEPGAALGAGSARVAESGALCGPAGHVSERAGSGPPLVSSPGCRREKRAGEAMTRSARSLQLEPNHFRQSENESGARGPGPPTGPGPARADGQRTQLPALSLGAQPGSHLPHHAHPSLLSMGPPWQDPLGLLQPRAGPGRRLRADPRSLAASLPASLTARVRSRLSWSGRCLRSAGTPGVSTLTGSSRVWGYEVRGNGVLWL